MAARLTYRRPRPDDAAAIFRRYSSDPAVTHYLGWPTHRTEDDARAFVAFSDAEWQKWGIGPQLIERADTGELIGSTGLLRVSSAVAFTGYVLARDQWGRGFATEALAAMVAWSRRAKIASLMALCHPDHAASARVLTKNGFRLNARFVPAVFANAGDGATEAHQYLLPPDVTVEALGGRADAAGCAHMMAASEPWITLKRTADALVPVMLDPAKEVHVIRDSRGIAAFVILDLRGLLNGYVQTICVRPDRRGEGLGSALLGWAECRILDQSPNVFLCVSSFNPGAQRLYARLGYERIGTLRDYIVSGSDEVLLRKTIRPLR